ncbi:MAG: hypothetical protein M9921_09450 [Fimbriimonadaceae bacterium]|nr:hypothetical protein [Chthonomonadaceae bacterium]MCO5297068.1 hypothetical protein [Fimbriimonadaceae bacterium]
MMLIPLLLIVAGFQDRTNPQGLLGADEVTHRLAANPPRSTESGPLEGVRAASRALSARLDALSPEQAAAEWLALLKRWETDTSTMPSHPNGYQWAEIMMPPLPAPAAWPLIRADLAKQPADAERNRVILLFDDLLGKDADVLRSLEGMRSPNGDSKKEDAFSPESPISKAERPIALRTGDLALLEEVYVRLAGGDAFWGGDGIPDLVRQFGKERAESMLHKIFEGSGTPFTQFQGTATQDLAMAVVVATLSTQKMPQWYLARGLADFPYVAALVGRFGEDAFTQYGTSGAAGLIYALGLAKRGQMEQAERVLGIAGGWSGDLATYVNGGWDEQTLFDLVATLLDRKPFDALWSLYSALGRSLGRSEEVAQRLDRWISNPDLAPESRALCLAQRATLDLAQGRSKAAVAAYKECVRLNARQYADTLLRLAAVVGDREALDFVAEAAKSMGTDVNRLDLFGAYLSQGRVSDAQEAVLSAAQDTQNVNLSAEGQGRLLNAYPDRGVQLAHLYYKADRPAEILTLLDEYPSWGANDLFDLVDYRSGTYYYPSIGGQTEPLGFYAAWAFGKTGRTPLAVRILHSLIPFEPRSDAACALLNELEGEAALSFYEQRVAANPLDARSLVWKGDLLLRVGRLKEAEASVRAAMALNPSGVTSHHQELEIFAAILDAEGDHAGAEAYRQRVEAARLADQGDREWRVGLYSQAADHYRQSLNLSPAQGSVQAQYAQALESLGNHREAVAASMKSLEILPGHQAGAIALPNVRILQNETDRRQARSLLESLKGDHPRDLGILVACAQFESRTGQDKEALASYEEALKIDPRCIQAWSGIASLAPSGVVSKKQIEEALLALIGLSPGSAQSYTISPAYGSISDKSGLWLAYHKATSSAPTAPEGPLYPLEASKRSMAAGSRPANNRRPPVRVTPGEFLSGLRELEDLIEVGRTPWENGN